MVSIRVISNRPSGSTVATATRRMGEGTGACQSGINLYLSYIFVLLIAALVGIEKWVNPA